MRTNVAGTNGVARFSFSSRKDSQQTPRRNKYARSFFSPESSAHFSLPSISIIPTLSLSLSLSLSFLLLRADAFVNLSQFLPPLVACARCVGLFSTRHVIWLLHASEERVVQPTMSAAYRNQYTYRHTVGDSTVRWSFTTRTHCVVRLYESP